MDPDQPIPDETPPHLPRRDRDETPQLQSRDREGAVGASTDEPAQPFWGFDDVLIAIGLIIPAALTGYLLARFLLLAFRWDSPPAIVPLMLAQFAAYAVLAAAVGLLLRTRYHRPIAPALRWHLPASQIGYAIRMGLAFAVGVLVLGVLLRTPKIESPMEKLLADPVSMVVIGALATTLGPMFEELAFRGFLQPVTVRSLGVTAGVIAAAVPFAVMHAPQYAWSWRHILLVGAAGAGFGMIRQRTGSTAIAALAHSVYNLVLFSGYVIGRAVNTPI